MEKQPNKDLVEKWQREALKLNEGYKQYAGDTLIGGLPDNILEYLVSQIIADTERVNGETIHKEVEEFVVHNAKSIYHNNGFDEYVLVDGIMSLMEALTPPPQETLSDKE